MKAEPGGGYMKITRISRLILLLTAFAVILFSGAALAGPKVVVRPAAGDPKVSISNFKFVPRVLTIAPGETVTWSNDDGAPHAVAFKDGAAGSGTLFSGKTVSRTFEKAGTYDYYCGIHNYMTGQIIVSPR